jgi:hypothetical protein
MSRAGFHLLGASFLAMAVASQGIAQAPAADTGAGVPQASPEELENLVGRIALYPDDLVAVILPASTNPLQIVQADRFLEKRKSDPKLPLDDKWDDSVKTLLNYPDVVKMMSGDLDWTSALGEAVVADQGAVLDAIQAFRRRAQAGGQPQEQRKASGQRRQDGDRDRPGQSGSDLRAAVQPDDGRRRGRARHGATTRRPIPATTTRIRRVPRLPPASSGAPRSAPAWGGARWGTNWGGGDININRNTNISTGQHQ